MVRKEVVIGTTKYKTQKECENHVRQQLAAVGITKSVRKRNPQMYDFLILLCQRHPRHLDKLKSVADFEVCETALQKNALALNIINHDGTITEISWRICVTGVAKSPHTKFASALRQSVDRQIQEYKESPSTNMNVCSLCSQSLRNKIPHIDHITHFEKLIRDFREINTFDTPDEYNKRPITYKTIFRPCDEWIGDLFYDYHAQHATLRVSCADCNLTRTKYK